MKIGIDAKSLSKKYTGIGTYVYDMIRYFNIYDKINEYYLFSNKEFELDFQLNKNFHKIIYPALIGSLGVMFKLPHLINKFGIDVFWGPEHIIPLLKSKAKTVVTVHDLALLRNPNWGSYYNTIIQKLFAVPSCRKSDCVIAISEATAKDVHSIMHIPTKKIKIICNGDSPYNYHTRHFTVEQINGYSG